ncbi:hypothetical protein Tco_0367784 [Tanacetum coccineum]
MGVVNPIHTLRDYSKPSHEGYRNTIELPVGNNVVPLRSDTIRLVQNGCSFHGLRSEDPNQHLKDFLKLMDSLDLDDEAWATIEELAQYKDEGWNDTVIPEEVSLNYENPDIEHVLGIMEHKVDTLMKGAISLIGRSESVFQMTTNKMYQPTPEPSRCDTVRVWGYFFYNSCDPGNDKEKNYRKRRLAELRKEMEGVINASGRYSTNFNVAKEQFVMPLYVSTVRFEFILFEYKLFEDVITKTVDYCLFDVVVGFHSFDSGPGNDEEKNYRKRRLAELRKEMEGVINASGQWKRNLKLALRIDWCQDKSKDVMKDACILLYHKVTDIH